MSSQPQAAAAADDSAQMRRSPSSNSPSLRLVPHSDPRSTRPSLAFAPVSRTLPRSDAVIRVGRYSEKESHNLNHMNAPSSAPIGFKSKVVSRRHCEFWFADGQWFIKDNASSSGTFLNHIRLSAPGVESRPFPVKDGDLVQLGIDFKGGEEMIFRCVKLRLELNRDWQKSLNNFNVSTHKRLRSMVKASTGDKADSDTASTTTSECSICLMSVAPCQSLFVAPCSHVWHYKCIRPMLNGEQYPSFLCPNCRAMTDLEADVDEPYPVEDWEEGDTTNNASRSTSMPLGDTPIHERIVARIAGFDSAARSSSAPDTNRTAFFEETREANTEEHHRIGTSPNSDSQPRAISSSNHPLEVTQPQEGPTTPRNDAGPFLLENAVRNTIESATIPFRPR